MNAKKVLSITVTFILLFSFIGIAQQYSYDYENMKMDEYKAELGKWQQRLSDAESALADEETKCQQTQSELDGVQAEINSTWNEIYGLLGTDEAGYQEHLAQLMALENDLRSFVALRPEDIYGRRDELDSYKRRYEEFKKDKRSLGNEAFETMGRIASLIQEAEEKAKPAAAGMYQVMRGDYLWKIARKPDIYGDPYAWMRIYTYNRDQIQNPDLIYPDQVFRIPRMAGPNEHWVARGEFLTGIAKMYGSSFNWQRIYEANKEVITDPNVIFPHMVLTVPR